MASIKDILLKHDIRMSAVQIPAPLDKRAAWAEGTTHWVCTLTSGGNGRGTPIQMRAVEFHQGAAHKKPPRADDVVSCLITDAYALNRSFEEWAIDLGYNPDSREAEKMYNTCVEQSKWLVQFLGADVFAELQSAEPL